MTFDYTRKTYKRYIPKVIHHLMMLSLIQLMRCETHLDNNNSLRSMAQGA